MSKTVTIDGKRYTVPDDATLDEIEEMISSANLTSLHGPELAAAREAQALRDRQETYLDPLAPKGSGRPAAGLPFDPSKFRMVPARNADGSEAEGVFRLEPIAPKSETKTATSYADSLGAAADFLMAPLESRDMGYRGHDVRFQTPIGGVVITGTGDPINELVRPLTEPLLRFPEAVLRNANQAVQDYDPFHQMGRGYNNLVDAGVDVIEGNYRTAIPKAIEGVAEAGGGAMGLMGLKGGPKPPGAATSLAQAERMAADTRVGFPGEVSPAVAAPAAPETPPPAAMSYEDVAELVRTASRGGMGSQQAVEKLARAAPLNKEAAAAAERLGIDVPPDVLLDHTQLKEAIGLTRSVPGSIASAAWKDAVERSATKADEAMAMIDGSPDLSEISSDVLKSMDDTQRALEAQANDMYKAINARISGEAPKAAEAPAAPEAVKVERRITDIPQGSNPKKTTEMITSPSQSDVARMLKQTGPENSLRYIKDKDGTIHIARGDLATHYDMLGGLKSDVTASDYQALDSGSIYRTDAGDIVYATGDSEYPIKGLLRSPSPSTVTPFKSGPTAEPGTTAALTGSNARVQRLLDMVKIGDLGVADVARSMPKKDVLEAASHIVSTGVPIPQRVTNLKEALEVIEDRAAFKSFSSDVSRMDQGLEPYPELRTEMKTGPGKVTPFKGADKPMGSGPDLAALKQQGFNTDKVYYHGGDVEFDTFDMTKAGRREIPWYGRGAYLTPDRKLAKGYAQRGGKVMPFYVRGKMLEIRKPEDWPSWLNKEAEIPQQLKDRGYVGIDIEIKTKGPKYGSDFRPMVDKDGKLILEEQRGNPEIVVFDPANIVRADKPTPFKGADKPPPVKNGERAERQVFDAPKVNRSIINPKADLGTTEIIRNPSQADLLRLSKGDGGSVRYFKDEAGNIYVANAYDTTHDAMLKATGQKKSVEMGRLDRTPENKFDVKVGDGNTLEENLRVFPMTGKWLRGEAEQGARPRSIMDETDAFSIKRSGATSSPPKAPPTVDLVNSRELMNKVLYGEDGISGLGGNTESLTTLEKKVLALSATGRKSPVMYDELKRLKQDIGAALGRRNSPYGDVNEGILNGLYGALAKDQLLAVERIGGKQMADDLRLANQIYAKERELGKTIISLFGRPDGGSIARKLLSALQSGAKGDVTGFNNIIDQLPAHLRKKAVATTIATMAKEDKTNAFGFSNYVKLYQNLRANSVVYKKVIQTLGPENEQFLNDLYKISKRITEARANVKTTGQANQALVQGMMAEGLVQKVLQSPAGRMMTIGGATTVGGAAAGPIAGGFSAMLVNALAKANKKSLNAAGDLFASPEWQQLVAKVAAEDRVDKRAFNAAKNSKAYQRWTKQVGITDPDNWLRQALASSIGIGLAQQSQPQLEQAAQ